MPRCSGCGHHGATKFCINCGAPVDAATLRLPPLTSDAPVDDALAAPPSRSQSVRALAARFRDPQPASVAGSAPLRSASPPPGVASAPTASPTAATALPALPGDVLRLIFACLPLRPRLLVVSRVCRLWRTHAYLSVTAIVHPYTYNGPFERHPNLTELHCAGPRGVPACWSPQQRALILCADFRRASDAVMSEAALPSLTSLNLGIEQHLSAAAQHLVVSATSLSDLRLSARKPSRESNLQALPRLPALRSLATDLSTKRHSFAVSMSHLTRLDLERRHFSDDAIPVATVPALRRLSLHMWGPRDYTPLGWLCALPSLAELCFRSESNVAILPIVQALSTRLVGIRLHRRETSTKLSNALKVCTALRELDLQQPSEALVEAVLPLSAQIRRLQILEPSDCRPAGPEALLTTHFSHVTELTIEAADRSAYAISYLERWRLPHLRVLRSTSSRALPWLTAALRTFPSLGVLQVMLVYTTSQVSDADIIAFAAEVRAADRRGVERLEFGYEETVAERVDLAALKRGLRWLTVVAHQFERICY